MLYHLALYAKEYVPALNVLRYISFRAMAALLTSLVFAFWWGGAFITFSKSYLRSKAREWTPHAHLNEKNDMPTMGGVFIVAVVLATVLLWAPWHKPEVWLFLLCLIGFACIGGWDDFCKLRYKKGINSSVKFFLQVLVAGLVACLWMWLCSPSTDLVFPFFKNLHPALGLLFIPWAIFVMVGTSNAVNLTDGLDGLAIGSLITNFATFSIICYCAGHAVIAQYLNIPFAGTAELVIPGAALLGASLGFLWYNTYPAQIFMGDVGSLALGGALAFMALACKQELLLLIAGGLFVIETLSVIIQVLSYKLIGRRFFRMAPLHHHFELQGWQESKITVRFCIISFVLCLLALMTLKLR